MEIRESNSSHPSLFSSAPLVHEYSSHLSLFSSAFPIHCHSFHPSLFVSTFLYLYTSHPFLFLCIHPLLLFLPLYSHLHSFIPQAQKGKRAMKAIRIEGRCHAYGNFYCCGRGWKKRILRLVELAAVACPIRSSSYSTTWVDGLLKKKKERKKKAEIKKERWFINRNKEEKEIHDVHYIYIYELHREMLRRGRRM